MTLLACGAAASRGVRPRDRTAIAIAVLSWGCTRHTSRITGGRRLERIRGGGAGGVIAHEGSLEYSAALPFYTGGACWW